MSGLDGAAQAHRNLCDFTRFHARLAPGSDLLDAAGVVAVAGPVDFPATRTAVRSDEHAAAAECADALAGFFDAHGRSACVFARVGIDDDLAAELVARDFHDWAHSPAMVCDHPLEPRDAPAGVTVRFASTPADVTAYAQIAGRAFSHLSIPAEITAGEVDNPGVMLGPDCAIALADLDGAPVAGALAVLFGAEPSGYVGWVACVDEARGRGLGDVVTRAVTNEAFARGARLVSLEASQFGESTYARMGYRELYRYRGLIRI